MRVIRLETARAKGLSRYYTGKPCGNGHVSERRVSNTACVQCSVEDGARWYKNNKERHDKVGKINRDKLKDEVIQALGNKCACCKEDRRVFLCVDHKNGNGNQHRRELNSRSAAYRWLRRQIKLRGLKAVRADFRILCWNCNSAFHLLGYCPHKPTPRRFKCVGI